MKTRAGQQFGNYRLLRLLGQGGFADVYLAEHLQLHRLDAIKVLQRRLIGNNFEDFHKEAQTVAQLKHPHIIQVFDFSEYNGSPYLVMEHASGGSLRQRFPKGAQMPLAEILVYVRQIAQALQYAHQQKLIHRDVKPENMLLRADDDMLLSDFGLVQLAHSTNSLATQEMAGTVLYMAPEQFQGKPRPASDQYALGVVVYEWLTGEPPFQGSFAEVMTQHISALPPSLCTKNARISPVVERVVLKALAKEPQQRFANEELFAQALQEAYQSASSTFFVQKERLQPGISESFRSTRMKQPPSEEAENLWQQEEVADGFTTQAIMPPVQRENRTAWPSQLDPFENSASRALPDSQDDFSVLTHSEQGEVGEEQWMNLRWFILTSALVVPLAASASLFLQPSLIATCLIPFTICFILGLIQTTHYDQWFWFVGFFLCSPATGIFYGVINPDAKPTPPINVKQLILVTSLLSYALAVSALIVQSGIVFYISASLFLSSWLLGLIRTFRSKQSVELFFTPPVCFFAQLVLPK